MKNTIYRQLRPEEFPLAKKFYKQHGQSSRTNRQDQIFVATDNGLLIACARVAPLCEHRLLRGVYVSPEHQRQTKGSQLLEYLLENSNAEEIWTFPYTHLVPLYAKLGFISCDSGAIPPTIMQAFKQYQAQGRQISIMSWHGNKQDQVF